MGDLQVCSSAQRNNDVPREGRPCHLPFTASKEGYNSSSIPEESWKRAEQATCEIVCKIQPTLVADEKRRQVLDYVQGLIRNSLGCEVFPYGSVPLKTYLPDGDIDLTALCNPTIEETLISEIHAVLRGEEQRQDARFEVKDVHCIDAEVKLVKCLVQNIVIDISSNQLGGLCTLCFLEQVDLLVGKDHLFKCSIILIKAWCYYESRILGSHHGLISTYALETLILYIFNLFHSSLNGPLAVLYKFLDYFSKFDWENYCVSINGPVCKSSLPRIVAAEVPENGGNDLLLSAEFIKGCAQMFSVPPKGDETNPRAFSQKHLNIIDPLRENNNLGRSVNRGNFFRICSAFKYGARKLGQILLLPRGRIADELKKFFANTLERHGSNHWAVSGHEDSGCSSPSFSDISSGDTMLLKRLTDGSVEKTSVAQVVSGFGNGPEIYSSKVVSSQVLQELCHFADGNFGCCFTGPAREIMTSRSVDLRSKNESADYLSQDLPQLYFSGFLRVNGNTENGNSCQSMPQIPVASGFMFSAQLQNNNPWKTTQQNLPLKENVSSQKDRNDISGAESDHNHHACKNRQSSGRGRFQGEGAQGQQKTLNNGPSVAPEEKNLLVEGVHELSKEEYPALENGKSRSSDMHNHRTSTWGPLNGTNGHSHLSGRHETRTPDTQPREAKLAGGGGSVQMDSSGSNSWVSSSSHTVAAATAAETPAKSSSASTVDQSYHLMNETDFPPLSL